MIPYPSYKDSGIEWIGEIPSDWGITKIKYETILPVQYGINIGSEYYVDEGVRFIRTTDITDDGNLIEGGVYLDPNCVEDIYKTQLNDLLISRSGTLGRTYLHSVEGNMTYGGYLVRFNFGDKTKSKFIFYYTKTRNFEDWLSLNTIQSTIGNVNGQKYSNLSFSKPPLPEQQQIVNYLDHNTKKIDELIEKTEQKIELLKENRISLINHCVTKGLNPNVEMKDSGVKWIGEIPSHWETIKGKYILKILTGNYPNDLTEDLNGIPFLKVDDLNNTKQDYYIDSSNLVVKEDKNIVPLEEDIILFPKRGMTIFTNKVVISRVKSYIDPNLMGVRVFDNSDKKFILLCIKNRGLGDICDSSTIPQINNKHIYPLEFPFPPLSEQQQIVNYLDEQTQKIDSTIEKETERIELLKEYRQSLISEVVTGKIDVRDWNNDTPKLS